jgi:hypothetical protein
MQKRNGFTEDRRHPKAIECKTGLGNKSKAALLCGSFRCNGIPRWEDAGPIVTEDETRIPERLSLKGAPMEETRMALGTEAIWRWRD